MSESPESPPLRSKTITVAIDRPVEQVYLFIVDPQNLPRWATAFVQSVRQVDGQWFVDTPAGAMKFRFYPRNACGVLDHYVTTPSGEEVLNPMRVFSSGAGSEVVFTLFQRPGMSDAEFAADTAMVTSDLETLRDVLEA